MNERFRYMYAVHSLEVHVFLFPCFRCDFHCMYILYIWSFTCVLKRLTFYCDFWKVIQTKNTHTQIQCTHMQILSSSFAYRHIQTILSSPFPILILKSTTYCKWYAFIRNKEKKRPPWLYHFRKIQILHWDIIIIIIIIVVVVIIVVVGSPFDAWTA